MIILLVLPWIVESGIGAQKRERGSCDIIIKRCDIIVVSTTKIDIK